MTDTATAATASFPALGTTAVVVTTEPGALAVARAAVEAVIAEVDAACSRFREDSELVAVNHAQGRAMEVSPTLFGALEAACWGAQATEGLVDPTVGSAMRILGYDRDFAAIEQFGPAGRFRVIRVPGWKTVQLDPAARTVRVPSGVELDLGATAKAWCTDRAAAAASTAAGGVLVSLGGDVAVAGPPPDGGWLVALADRHDQHHPSDPIVSILVGGLATSGTAARRWWRGDAYVHHIVDPATSLPAPACWRTASVAASSCLAANVASTATIVLGPAAPAWLAARSLPARLVAEDGTVTTIGGWPSDEAGDASAGAAT